MKLISEKTLDEIVKISDSVPEKYQVKCFEILLNSVIKPLQPTVPGLKADVEEKDKFEKIKTPGDEKFLLPIDVKAFLSQYGLNEAILWKFFVAEGEQIRPIYTLKVTKKATAQIQHALMLCLETAMISGQFEINKEALRERCKDQKSYDGGNFNTNLKVNEKNFKAVEGVDILSLSPDGKSELADLLEELSG
jgi:hypothetical protein